MMRIWLPDGGQTRGSGRAGTFALCPGGRWRRGRCNGGLPDPTVNRKACMAPGENPLGSFGAEKLFIDKKAKDFAGKKLSQSGVVKAEDLVEGTRLAPPCTRSPGNEGNYHICDLSAPSRKTISRTSMLT